MKDPTVGIPLYPGFDSLDVLGPYQTFTFAGMKRYLLAETLDLVTSFEGVSIKPDQTFEGCPPLDLLFVPGGSDPVGMLLKGHPGNNAYLDFLSAKAKEVKLVCSVCNGALLLAGAGLLDGHTATTHWAFREVLELFPCQVAEGYPRYVRSGTRITGGGISSGLDLAMYIVSELHGEDTARMGQLFMQYHPEPMFHCGDPADSQTTPEMVSGALERWQIADARKTVSKWLGKRPRE